MNQIKSDYTVISLCVGWLLVSVLLAPSLTPDSLSVDLGPVVLYRLIDLQQIRKIVNGLFSQIKIISGHLKSFQP